MTHVGDDRAVDATADARGDSCGGFSGLHALFLNCTLKPSPALSHTEALMAVSMGLMKNLGASVQILRPVDYQLAPGVYPDRTAHGADRDDWPGIYDSVRGAHILVVGTPIWLGEKSSVCNRLIERLYSNSAELNEHGQYADYGKVGGCIVTGNEDAMNILYSLQHLGCVIPPQADAGWIGEPGRVRRTWIRDRAARKTTSPSGTPTS